MSRKREPKVYMFATVSDFRRLPPEKLRHALYDFELWLRMLDLLGKTNLEPTHGIDSFSWTDDGRHDVSAVLTIHTKAPDGTITNTESVDVVEQIAGPVRGADETPE